MLFDVPEVSGVEIPFWTILLPVVGSFASFAALVLYALGRSFAREQSVGWRSWWVRRAAPRRT